MRRARLACVMGLTFGLALASPGSARGPCRPEMAYVEVKGQKPFCIDRWEATVVEMRSGREVPHAANQPVTDLEVKAVSRSGVLPQGYISRTEAEAACGNAKKRLCTGAEWMQACRGRTATQYPYGDERKPGVCNDSGRAPVAALHRELGDAVYSSVTAMNDPRINAAPHSLAKTGRFAKCKSSFGVFDMVGNLHEWVADVQGTRGTFRGGYYQDTTQNGEGCSYVTVAHDVNYHDYSTGFRCCANPR